MSEFKDKVIIITGAAGNLGEAVAQRFAQDGAKIALVDIEEEGMAETASRLPAETTCISIKTNLFEPESVAAMADAVKQQFGNCDYLANIAGGFAMGSKLYEASDREWQMMMGLNAQSVFHSSRVTIPQMIETGAGRIVSISARAAREGKATMGPYCASKAAVITLTESMAAEHKMDNINVNCILPGTIDTPENRSAMPDADFDNWVPPAALADVVAFLCSDAARCVTGAAVPVYGKS
ncbi:3-oxoacyl-ACP reductase [Solemya velum gill symbiont]|nr:3-oxoacyl-ACP reductase [Solemya velum gill symbiont]